MKKFSFENLHPNHKYAFADGLLCGLIIAWLANQYYQDYKEQKELREFMAETKKNESDTPTA